MKSTRVKGFLLASLFGVSIIGFTDIASLLTYFQAKSQERIALEFVKRDDVKDIIKDLDETAIKMEVRRQFYLYTKGSMIDDVQVTFSILELFKAGILDQKIEAAKQSGRLDLSAQKISSLYGLSRVAGKVEGQIKELDLSSNSLVAISKKSFNSYLYLLESLNLSHNQIVYLQDGCFNWTKKLKFLDLGHNQIITLPSGVFKNLIKLEGIDLSDNKIKYEDPMWFVGLKKLKKVNLADN